MVLLGHADRVAADEVSLQTLTISDPIQDLPEDALHWFSPGEFPFETQGGRTTYVHSTERTPGCQLGIPRGQGVLKMGLDYLQSGQDTLRTIHPDRSTAYGGKLFILWTLKPSQYAGTGLLSYDVQTSRGVQYSPTNPFAFNRASHLFTTDDAIWFTCDRGFVRVDRFAGEWELYEWKLYHRSVPNRKTLMFSHDERVYFCNEDKAYVWQFEGPDVEPDPLIPCGYHLLSGDTLWTASKRAIYVTDLGTRAQKSYELPEGFSFNFFALARGKQHLWVLLGGNRPAVAAYALGQLNLENGSLRRIRCPRLGSLAATALDFSDGFLWLGTQDGVIRIDPGFEPEDE
jgi:hypothetical protein